MVAGASSPSSLAQSSAAGRSANRRCRCLGPPSSVQLPVSSQVIEKRCCGAELAIGRVLVFFLPPSTPRQVGRFGRHLRAKRVSGELITILGSRYFDRFARVLA